MVVVVEVVVVDTSVGGRMLWATRLSLLEWPLNWSSPLMVMMSASSAPADRPTTYEDQGDVSALLDILEPGGLAAARVCDAELDTVVVRLALCSGAAGGLPVELADQSDQLAIWLR